MNIDYYLPLSIDDCQRFLGVQDEHLRLLEKTFSCELSYRADYLFVKEISEKNWKELLNLLENLPTILGEDAGTEPKNIFSNRENNFSKKSSLLSYTKNGKPIYAKNNRQEEMVTKIKNNTIVFATGSAGTGKTFLAVVMAVQALKNGDVEKIVLSRPAVEAGENLGFLPGDIHEKLDPYFLPLYDSLEILLGKEQLNKYVEKGFVEIIPLAYMRGRTFQNSFVILDEAQNTSSKQMLMFLTRLGHRTKMVITGDISQIDLSIKKANTGLVFAINHLQGVSDIDIIQFQNNDVVRHPLIKKIVERFQVAGL